MAKICPFVREKVTYLDCMDCGNRGCCEDDAQKSNNKHVDNDGIQSSGEERGAPDD